MTPVGEDQSAEAHPAEEQDERAPSARIVHLSTVHHDWDNRITNKECRALAEAGLDVHLIISAPEKRVTHGVHVHAIRKRGRLGKLVWSQVEAWQVLRRVRADLLHVHDPELIPLALVWRLLRRRPVVYDAHEDLVKQLATKTYLRRGPASLLARPVARLLIGLADRGCDGIVTATAPIAATFSPLRRGRPRPVQVVRNLPWGSDFEVVDAGQNEPIAVYTGDISEGRGISRMIDAVHHVPGVTLLLAGRALVPAEQLTEATDVDWLGLVPPSELPGIIGRGRVGLILLERLPNYENSLPTKVFEYMASGIPFLATDFPVWRELFGGYDAGVFVDVDDPEAVRQAFEDLITDPEKCRRMGRNGRRAFDERFGFEAEAAALVAFELALVAEN